MASLQLMEVPTGNRKDGDRTCEDSLDVTQTFEFLTLIPRPQP